MSRKRSGMKDFNKNFTLASVTKSAGAEITPEMLEKINCFAPVAQIAEGLYVRKFFLAHNAIDRDNERFPDAMLEDFARTLPGKSLLKVHDRRSLAVGLWFKAVTEEMSPEKYKELTGEAARLPEGVTAVKVLVAWAYTLADEADINKKLDAGIIRHVSIGFMAADLVAIKEEPTGHTKYREYVCPGEATEGSLVWLGAQPGAVTQKSLFGDDDEGKMLDKKNYKEDRKEMDELIKRLQQALGKTFGDEDELVLGLKEMKTEMEGLKAAREKADAARDEALKKADELDAKVRELEPLAAEGKAYRGDLVERYAKAKALMGEIDETPEASERVKGFAKSFDVAFLEGEVKNLEARVAKKFPSEAQTKGGDPDADRDKSGDGKDGEKRLDFRPAKKEDE